MKNKIIISDNYKTPYDYNGVILKNVHIKDQSNVFEFVFTKTRFNYHDNINKRKWSPNLKQRIEVNQYSFFDYFIITKKIKVKIDDLPKFIKQLRKHCNEESVNILVKKIKQQKYQLKQKDWTDVLPPEIVKWIYKTIHENVDESCMDNFRACDLSKSSQKRRYDRDRENGCCGFFDEVFICPIDNKRYLIGCNFGH